ncbi:hypothetical protein BsWGS_05721 [Bradybaena similaris]
MELIKNLMSPRARRKKLELAGGDVGSTIIPASPNIFGLPLEELMSKAPPSATVPPVVIRICEYIYKYGLDNVGLFRVSGSVRVVEKIRMQFEQLGDANLEEENDVAATAGLLRVFLRDLPDTLIPSRLTRHFFSVIQDSQRDKDTMVAEVKKALSLLPVDNYNLLKYISSLLVVVADNEADNKMSAMSLAILFGPNVFKYELTSGIGGLKDMDSSKDIVHLFISEYGTLFAEEGDLCPKEFWESCRKKKVPPPRPPPPKVQSLPSFSLPSADNISTTFPYSASFSSLDLCPVPPPRKVKTISDSNSSSDVDGSQTAVFSVNHVTQPVFSPKDDIDHTRAYSPFTLESDTHSIIESPVITARTYEFVEKIIEETVSEHIFGVLDFNQNSGQQSPRSPRKNALVDDIDLIDGSSVDNPGIKPSSSAVSRPGVSKAVASSIAKVTPLLQPAIDGSSPSLQDFDSVERSEVLKSHKKPQGPTRHLPSRKYRPSGELDEGQETISHPPPVTVPKSPSDTCCLNPKSSSDTCCLNHSLNHTQENTDKENEGSYTHESDRVGGSPPFRPRTLHRNDGKALSVQSLSMQNTLEPSCSLQSPSSGSSISPSSTIKLFIPPLDLSTLHEHVDGVDPIPLSVEYSETQVWMKAKHLAGADDVDVAIISPRSHKLRKRNEASLNTDIPPSPPIQQDLYKKYSDDDCNHQLRQMTKKIQGLKKKIKNFEETFEKDHGYRPSHGEKSAQPDIKKYMSELSKVRKDLKRLKEETEKGNRSRHNSGASSSGVEMSPPVIPSVATTLDFILKCLNDKRHDSGRPEEVMLMSRDQVQEEKLAVQRALLHFEGLHGRPTSREEKELMRPLYDRYRSVKRMLAKPMSPRNSLELQTVPEDQMMEIPRSFIRDPVRVPTADLENDAGSNDFGFLTQDLMVVQELDVPTDQDKGLQQAGGGGRDDSSITSEDGRGDVRLHEMSLSELHVEIEASRGQKKKLRRSLRQYEEDFFLKNGRKVQKEDRYPLQTEYSDYKKVKARLRLLEALILKHHNHE